MFFELSDSFVRCFLILHSVNLLNVPYMTLSAGRGVLIQDIGAYKKVENIQKPCFLRHNSAQGHQNFREKCTIPTFLDKIIFLFP